MKGVKPHKTTMLHCTSHEREGCEEENGEGGEKMRGKS